MNLPLVFMFKKSENGLGNMRNSFFIFCKSVTLQILILNIMLGPTEVETQVGRQLQSVDETQIDTESAAINDRNL